MIRENVVEVKERIAQACLANQRSVDSVRLVAVVKTRSAQDIEELLGAGIFDLGENRVQEAREHVSALTNSEYFSAIRWHLIGHP